MVTKGLSHLTLLMIKNEAHRIRDPYNSVTNSTISTTTAIAISATNNVGIIYLEYHLHSKKGSILIKINDNYGSMQSITNELSILNYVLCRFRKGV